MDMFPPHPPTSPAREVDRIVRWGCGYGNVSARLAQEWGAGEVASADGLRFVVPVRTITAGPNRKYFNADRGVTYHNFTSDQFTGFYAIVIPKYRKYQQSPSYLLVQLETMSSKEVMMSSWALNPRFSRRTMQSLRRARLIPSTF
jgi:Tn3 transposase DDE domain